MKKLGFIAVILIGLFVCACGGLFYSAQNGDIEGLKVALHGTEYLESTDQTGATPLIVAAYNGKTAAVDYLCSIGANVNAQDMNGATALIHASYYNLTDVVEVLLKYNADKTIKDRYGNTAFYYADRNEFIRIMNMLK